MALSPWRDYIIALRLQGATLAAIEQFLIGKNQRISQPTLARCLSEAGLQKPLDKMSVADADAEDLGGTLLHVDPISILKGEITTQRDRVAVLVRAERIKQQGKYPGYYNRQTRWELETLNGMIQTWILGEKLELDKERAARERNADQPPQQGDEGISAGEELVLTEDGAAALTDLILNDDLRIVQKDGGGDPKRPLLN